MSLTWVIVVVGILGVVFQSVLDNLDKWPKIKNTLKILGVVVAMLALLLEGFKKTKEDKLQEQKNKQTEAELSQANNKLRQ